MINIAAADLKRLVDLSETNYPREACALLIGRVKVGDHRTVTRIEPSANVAEMPERRFEIDPGLRIGIERELRGRTEGIIGVWHSHPNGLAEPSTYDAASVFEPELCWLITAVVDGQALQTLAYAPMPRGGFRFLPLNVT